MELGVGPRKGGRDLGDERYTGKVEELLIQLFTFPFLVSPSQLQKQHEETKIK